MRLDEFVALAEVREALAELGEMSLEKLDLDEDKFQFYWNNQGDPLEDSLDLPIRTFIANVRYKLGIDFDRIFEKINCHIANKHDVCPFAKKVARGKKVKYVGLPKIYGATDDVRARLRLALAEFVDIGLDKDASMIIVLPKSANHQDAEEQANKVRVDLEYVVAERLYLEFGGDSNLLNSVVQRKLDACDFLFGNPNHNVIVLNRELDHRNSLFVFAANPNYNKEHPRFLPHDAIVVTFNGDIKDASDKDGVMYLIQSAFIAGIICPFIADFSYDQLKDHFLTIYRDGGVESIPEHLRNLTKPFYMKPIQDSKSSS
jgi:hypothetical protein